MHALASGLATNRGKDCFPDHDSGSCAARGDVLVASHHPRPRRGHGTKPPIVNARTKWMHAFHGRGCRCGHVADPPYGQCRARNWLPAVLSWPRSPPRPRAECPERRRNRLVRPMLPFTARIRCRPPDPAALACQSGPLSVVRCFRKYAANKHTAKAISTNSSQLIRTSGTVRASVAWLHPSACASPTLHRCNASRPAAPARSIRIQVAAPGISSVVPRRAHDHRAL
jgi:hypothetical protein